jgi:signal peptidase I
MLACFALLSGAVLANGATERPVGPLTLDRALADAHRLAARHEGGEVVRVEGDSMFPFFGGGSVLVTKSVAPERLRPGMVVVYRNRFGETVAHRLERLADDGWVARGYNNEQEDSTRVTESNLFGVVYATFYSNGRIGDENTIASLLEGTSVALAAAAR